MTVAILRTAMMCALSLLMGARLAWGQAQPLDLTRNFSVTDDGKAALTIPIVAPPGTSGMHPNIRLEYNSQSDNGILGKGWNINGLSFITRCARDLARDNVIGSINYDANDRFCMQGQRLIAISGAYGQSGTSYRTERETWSDIKSEGVCGNGPCSFTVRTRDGLKLEFATTENARIRFAGNGAHVYLWALNRVTDKNGNFWDVEYNRSDYAFTPKILSYTGNSKTGLAPTKNIQFIYEDRSDYRPLWANGVRQEVRQRVREIQVNASNELVRSYKLSYINSATSRTSLLKKIDECSVSGQCLLVSEFEYNQPNPGFNASKSFDLPGKIYHNNRDGWDVKTEGLLQDLDGDGIVDFTRATCWDQNLPCDLKIYRGNGNGYHAYDGWQLPGHVFKNEYAGWRVKTEGLLQDLDGDGIADYTRATCWKNNPPNGQACDLQIWRGTGHGFVKESGWTLPKHLFFNEGEGEWNFKSEGILQDLNGDGVADFSTGTCWDKEKPCDLRIWKGTRRGYQLVPGWELPFKVFHNEYDGWRVKGEAIVQDLNGDGITDFSRATCWEEGGCDTMIYHGTGHSFVNSGYSMPAGEFVYKNEGNGWRVKTEGVFQDFNGDGIADFTRGTVWHDGTNRLRIYYGTGRGYRYENFNLDDKLFHNKSHDWEVKTEGVLFDFNNDGLLDYTRGTDWDIGDPYLTVFHGYGRDLGGSDFQNSGYGLPDKYFFNESEGYRIKTEGVLRDLNGDGAIDYTSGTCFNDASGTCRLGVHLNKSVNPDTLRSIRNRIGGQVHIDYQALTRSGIHARSMGSIYPKVDSQSATYVVSHYALSDGNGAVYNFDYQYEGAKVSQDGRGWLGFGMIAQTNREAGIITKKYFHQDFPRAGLMDFQDIVRLNGNLLKRQRYEYVSRSSHAGVYVVENSSDRQDLFLDGSYDYTLAKNYEYDEYGNATVVHDIGDINDPSDNLATCASFSNDLASWQLGNITAIKVTKDLNQCEPETLLTFSSASDFKLTRFTWDSEFNLVAEERYRDTFNDFVKTSYKYDAYGNRIETQNALGAIESVEFDALTHTFPVKFLSALNQNGQRLTTSATYSHKFGQILTQTDMNGNVTQNRYDDFGRLIERLGGSDQNGNLVSLEQLSYTDCPGSGVCAAGLYLLHRSRPTWADSDEASWPWTKTFVDGLGRQYLTQTVGGDQGEKIIERWRKFDAQGRIIQESSPAFQGDPVNWAQQSYDIHSSPTRMITPDGAVTSTCYGLGNDSLNIQDACQQEPTQGFSLLRMSRPVEKAPEEPQDSYADIIAQIEQSINNQSALTRANRQTLIAGPDPRLRNDETSQLNRSLQNFNPQGLMIRDQAIDESEVTYQYNAMGQLTTVKDRSGAQTSYTYDSLGNVIQVNDSTRGTRTYLYDELSRLIETRDARGSVLKLTYDRLNRPVKREIFAAGHSHKPESSSVLAYDDPSLANSMGQLASVSWDEWDESERALLEYRQSFAYDAYGRTTLDQLKIKSDRKNRPLEFLEHNKEVNYTSSMEYLPTGKIAKRVFPDGAVLTYAYNASLHLEAIELQETKKNGSLDTAQLIARFSDYTALGQYQKMVYGNGVESHLTYDALGRMISKETLSKDGESAEKLSYLWNKAGKLYSIEDGADSSRNQEFYYDMRGRLESAKGPYGSKSYVYDPSGNPLVIDDLSFEYSPGSAHQIAKVLDSKGRELGAYTYDANGNITSQPVLDSDRHRHGRNDHQDRWYYTYDSENRLVEVRKGHSSRNAKLVNRFVYAPSGERLKKIDANGKTTLYLGSGYEVAVQGHGKQTHTKHIVDSQGVIAAFTKDYIRGKQLTLLDQNHNNLMAQAANGGSFEGLQLKVSSWLHLASMGLEETIGNTILTGWIVVFALVFGWICYALTRIHFGLRKGFIFRQIAHVLSWAIILLAQPSCSSPPAWKSGPNGQGYPSGERYFHKNHQNSTTLVSNAKGQAVARVSYEPFGKLHVESSSGEDSFRQKYTDKELDSDSGLYYFGSRFYDPITGRFLTPDPAWQYHNPYMIGGNDPLSGIDPDGEFFWFLIAVFVGALVGGYVGGAMANGNNFNPAQWDWTSGKTWGAIFAGGILGGLGAGAGAAAAAAGASIRVIIGIEAAVGAAEGLVSGAISGKTGLDLFTSTLIGAGAGALLGGVFAGAGSALGKGFGSAIGTAARSADAPSGQAGQLRVFWSGPGAMDAAAAYARANGGITLEMTPLGRALTKLTNVVGFKHTKGLWQKASERFARQAQGPVHAFHSADGVRLQSIWTRIEYPILKSRGVDINYHVSPSVLSDGI
ncbi:RHS repeat-associated core domain-containing protein [Oligoflexus tunisiensis]|uniref:RHS repeat-associated core domain-containing protein n=1 Tax=Oligoflexus tunisiensis TaxID=708132 RepID=UPI000AAAE560|nr:RHS repeat-associated core domain-containing protein [Oligoflexus tunisiensis]